MNPKPGTDREVVRRTLDAVRNARTNRDRSEKRLEDRMREAREAGASLREIAEASGFNHQTVANKLAENGEQQ